MEQSFLILHGLGGSGPEHWQSWLNQKLLAAGEKVFYPTLPEYDEPTKKVWIQTLEDTVNKITSDNITVVAHSLGCILWLHFALQKGKEINNRINRVILVAPPSPYLKHEFINRFFPLPIKGKETIQLNYSILQIQSTNDPYCSITDSQFFRDLGIKQLFVADKGHINIDSGFGKWQWILDYCLNQDFDYALDKAE